MSLHDAARIVPDGATIGFGGANALWRRPLAFVREMVRQGRRDLHVYNMIAGIETDLLIGAGCVASTNAAYVGLDMFGQSANFQRAVRAGTIKAVEYTEFGFIAALRASSMGLPYLPWRTGAGTDVVAELGWASVRCPYTDAELLAVPALELDVTVIQAGRCDRSGNVEVTDPPDFIYDYDSLLARAGRLVIVCVEEIAALSSPSRCGLLGQEVDLVVHAPSGSWPGGFVPCYGLDSQHLEREYLPATESSVLFDRYVRRFVFDREEFARPTSPMM